VAPPLVIVPTGVPNEPSYMSYCVIGSPLASLGRSDNGALRISERAAATIERPRPTGQEGRGPADTPKAQAPSALGAYCGDG